MILALSTMDPTLTGIFYLVAVILFIIAAVFVFAPTRGDTPRRAIDFVALGLAFFVFPAMWNAFRSFLTMTEEEFQADLQTKYPQIWAVLNKPGVYAVVRQAIEQNWPKNRLDAELQQTEYFRLTPDVQRQWDILAATDPATARKRGDEMTQKVRSIAGQYGITLTDQNQWDIVVSGLNQNWGDAEIKHALLFGAAFSGLGTGPAGEIAGTAHSVKTLAAQYGVPMSDQAAKNWALGIADGVQTAEGLTAYMVEQAKSMFPGLSSALDQGTTVRQYIDPYIQDTVQNLGINAADFDLQDAKWSAAINQVDPTTGNRMALSRQDWVKKIRTDPTYGYSQTQQGQAAGAQFADALGQKLGLV